MNPSSARSHSTARIANPQPTSSSPSEDAFHAPPIEKDPEGRDVTGQPGAEVGHYGMGYGDPTRHQGGTWPAEGASLPPQPAVPDAQGDAQGATSRPKGKGGGQQ